MQETFYACSCGQRLAIKPEMTGKAARCPSCLASLRIGADGRVEEIPSAPVELGPEPAPAEDEPQRRCPVCGERILVSARKCKHCGEFLPGTGATPSAESPPEPAVLFYVLAFFVPLAGIILGALYLSKPSKECKDFGKISLICAVAPMALGCVISVVWIAIVLLAVGVGSVH